MYIICETENEVDSIILLTKSKYKFQRLDGKWITPYINVIGLPVHTTEEESLTWYAPGTKQYEILINRLGDNLDIELDMIEKVYSKVKRKFLKENIIMGITESGQTQFVLNVFRDIDYAMTNCSIYAAFDLIDNITRSAPFLTEERLTQFKADILSGIS